MTKRVTFIDAMRGFSLLGILLANLLIFQYGMYGTNFIKDLSFIDNTTLKFLQIFVVGSFMPIFTFLFGYSLIKLIDSTRRRKNKSRWTILRRATGLITLGLLHSLFIWDGDILLFYGLTMIFLVPFINRQPKTILLWAGLFFISSTVALIALSNNMGSLIANGPTPQMQNYLDTEKTILQNGSYSEILDFKHNAKDPFIEVDGLLYAALLTPFAFAPLFLVGMALAKLHAFEQMASERKWYIRGILLIPLALLIKSLAVLSTSAMAQNILLLGGQLLALGYIALCAFLYDSKPVQKFIPYFEAVGKLSLSNYILQSVVCTFIFYGYGLGYFARLGIFNALLLGIVLFALQCVGSRYYLQFIKRGPLEAILRVWTNFSFRLRNS